MRWKLVEEWECPKCGEDWESIYPCSFCQKLRSNEPINLNLSFLNKNNQLPRGIMLYSSHVSSVLSKKITQKHWGDYEFLFYPKEFLPPKGKSLDDLHIHVLSKKGDIRVFLDNFRVKQKKKGIPKNQWDAISEFVEANYNDVIFRVEVKLREVGIIK